jgi:uncharacterized MnhB-related membrane protein
MVIIALIMAAAVISALQALRVQRLLMSALWLAGTSALVSLVLYLMGAPEIAVVELSVGAGLVTILFVFAISVAGDEKMDVRTVIPRPLAIGLVLVAVALLGGLALGQPALSITAANAGASGAAVLTFSNALWQQRGLDVLLQIVIIFCGVLGVLGLLADVKANRREQAASLHTANGNGHHSDAGRVVINAPSIQEAVAELQSEVHP